LPSRAKGSGRPRKAEEAAPGRELPRQVELLVQLAVSCPIGILYVDAADRVAFANERAERILGLSAGALVGRVFEPGAYRITKPDGSPFPESESLWRRTMETGEPLSEVHFVIERPDGGRSLVSVSAAQLRDDAGRPAGVATTIEDITAREATEAALRRCEERFRRFYEMLPSYSFMISPDGSILDANPAALRAYGCARDELVGKPVTALYAPESLPRVRELFARWAETGELKNEELVILTQRGERRTVLLSASAVRDAGGAILHSTSVQTDITELRRAEEQIRRTQKLDAVGRVASGVAHDFNSLLATVLTYAEMVLLKLPPDSPLREPVEAIRAAAWHGADLTRELAAFTSHRELEMRTMVLDWAVADFARTARRLVPADIHIVTQVGTSESAMVGDRGAIEQILMNLLTNARDAMKGGGKVTFAVERREVDEALAQTAEGARPGVYLVLSVSDTGTGMDAETRSRLFEPFFTTKPIGEGTGLGLSTVYGLTRQHGGFVQVRSELGRGTSVSVFFPPAEDLPVEIAPARPAARGHAESILVVEDDRSLRQAIEAVLAEHGYVVHAAQSSEQALEAVRSLDPPPDLLICDVVLPDMSGPRLVHAIAEQGFSPSVLYISGHARNELEERAKLAADAPLITKPWSVSDLLAKVRAVLDEAS